jgi:hypothetical protein
MKKNLLPILLAGAGAVIFFIMKKNKKEDNVTKLDQFSETDEAQFTTKPKKVKSIKSLDVNKAINNLSKLKNSKGAQIVKKAVKKKLAKKKGTKSTSTFISPLQPQKKQVKFF